jgi:chromosome segregation ATPase
MTRNATVSSCALDDRIRSNPTAVVRKARMQATEISKERDRLNGQVESLRNELQDAKREVVTVRRSVVEEKQSLEHRLDEERKAKERARAQLDTRMDELQKRKSKFACM